MRLMTPRVRVKGSNSMFGGEVIVIDDSHDVGIPKEDEEVGYGRDEGYEGNEGVQEASNLDNCEYIEDIIPLTTM